MGLKAYIHNFRRIHDAEISIFKITLLAGANYAGKTSIAQAIGAALTGQSMPWAGLLKKDSRLLVNDDAKKAFVRLENETGNTTIEWPGLEVKAEGVTPPQADPVSAGLKNLFSMNDKDRAKYFSELLNSQPTKEDLKNALAEHSFNEKFLKSLWDTIQQLGWDETHVQTKEKGAKLKGRWEQVTGQNYGKQKAYGWQPDAWTFDLEKAQGGDLEAEVNQAKEWLEAGITDTAVEKTLEEKELADLKMKADLMDSLADRVDQAKKAHGEALAAHEKATKAYETAKAGLISELTETCPHCDKPLKIVKGHIAKAETVDTKTIKDSEQAADKAKTAQAAAWTTMQTAYQHLVSVQNLLSESQEAAKKLAEYKPPVAVKKSEADIQTARTHLAKAEERLKVFGDKTEADGIFKLIEQNLVILGILAPDGLRLTKLQAALTQANAELAELSRVAKYDTFTIQPDMSILYGGRPYSLWWGSEQYRAKILMTLFVAKKTGADCAIFDGAEILDSPGRNGMIKVIQKVGVPALVCMTIGRAEYDKIKPLLAGVDTYWLTEGVIA